jgi:predicted ATPase
MRPAPKLLLHAWPEASLRPAHVASEYRHGMVDAFVRSVRLASDQAVEGPGYPWDVPAVTQLRDGPELHPKVTYLIGENGSGKSTLLAAIAMAAGMNPEGGSSNYAFPDDGAYAFSRRDSLAALGDLVQLIRGSRRPRTDFFLRAESLFVASTYLEQLDRNPLGACGGKSLHEQSHGEGLLAIMLNRFGPDGF